MERYEDERFGFSVKYDAKKLTVDQGQFGHGVFRRKSAKGWLNLAIATSYLPSGGIALEDTTALLSSSLTNSNPGSMIHNESNEQLIKLSDDTEANYFEIEWRNKNKAELISAYVITAKNDRLIVCSATDSKHGAMEKLTAMVKSLRLDVEVDKTAFNARNDQLGSTAPAPTIHTKTRIRDYWPTDGWKASSPEQQGLDSYKLTEALDFIQDHLPDVYSFIVVKNGYVVFEKYYKMGGPDRRAPIHSVTKSVMSALIGIALKREHFKSIDQKLAHFFPSYFSDELLDEETRDITLKHLLTMSAGFGWNDGAGLLFREWIRSPDLLEYTLQLPQIDGPGTKFNYNTSLSHILSIFLSTVTQTSTLEFARQHLFIPLGIQARFWSKDTKGFNTGGYGLHLTPHDLSKIGYLYVNNGFWDGQSIIPETWIKESTEQQMYIGHFSSAGEFGYGYQWWVKKVGGYDSFFAWGRRGQFIVVVPKLDLVFVVTSKAHPADSRTTLHYTHLFDLVANAVIK
jgi:CubicO group peptidase (beta-lactamase class C family)